MRIPRACISLVLIAFAAGVGRPARAQGALLLQDADSFAEAVSPLGHTSVYFARICAASLTQLRRCRPGELGVVIARHRGVAGFDWLAIPLVPFLYSVDEISEVPSRVDRASVQALRLRYHDAHLSALGDVPEGGQFRRGWNQLVGASFERRIYAFRFETTPQQDDALIAHLNAEPNRSRFSFLARNCADFSNQILDLYFPHAFHRHVLSDAGIVTPRQVAYELVRYARKHPEIHLSVAELPLVPGFHKRSRVGISAAMSMIATGYVVPIAIFSPYAAGAIVADSLLWGRYPLHLGQAQVLKPDELTAFAGSSDPARFAGEADAHSQIASSR